MALAGTRDRAHRRRRVDAQRAGAIAARCRTRATHAFKALKELRSDDVTDAAEALARRCARSRTCTPTSPPCATRSARRSPTTSTCALRRRSTRPRCGRATRDRVTVTVANGARATLDDVRATLTGARRLEAVPRPRRASRARCGRGRPESGSSRSPCPEAQRPGTVDASARVRYEFERVTVTVAAPLTVEVVSAITVASMQATPSPVRPGGSVTVTTTLRNAGRAAATGALQVGVPNGWTVARRADGHGPRGRRARRDDDRRRSAQRRAVRQHGHADEHVRRWISRPARRRCGSSSPRCRATRLRPCRPRQQRVRAGARPDRRAVLGHEPRGRPHAPLRRAPDAVLVVRVRPHRRPEPARSCCA